MGNFLDQHRDRMWVRNYNTVVRWKVYNVTSKSESMSDRQLSPFYPHGGIPVPGNPGLTSESLEGVWQGLKVIEHEGVNPKKFKNATMLNIKRSKGSKWGDIRGHWLGPLNEPDSSDAVQLLGYINARRQVYVPMLTWVLENKVEGLVQELVRGACESDIVLLDYYTNVDVDHIDEPLSHAGLLKQYIENNWQRLM
ncbi:hypothetical protein WJX72_002735 [[Myrmecia] bisecta]|uniref:Uncharacterized protein n=1 Tax=[Myrmecia] bisecta TaxID=41462 RepID=A0AAW1QQH0_9CHLO